MACSRRAASAAGISAIAAGSRPSRVLVPSPDGHRTLGVGAQGEAGDAEVGRLLLDPAGVGEDRAGVGEQGEEVEVAERLGEQQPRVLGAGPSIILRVRGWTGKTTGISRGQRGRAARPSRRSSGPSTSAGRCRVTSR